MIENIWKQFEDIFSAEKGKNVSDLFLGPASSYEVEGFEKLIQVELPSKYKKSLSIHEGGVSWLTLWHSVALLDLKQVKEAYSLALELRRNSGGDSGIRNVGCVRPVFFDNRWVPVADDNGVMICLDLNPPPNGIHGQIIALDWEDCTIRVIAEGFEQFLADGLAKLKKELSV